MRVVFPDPESGAFSPAAPLPTTLPPTPRPHLPLSPSCLLLLRSGKRALQPAAGGWHPVGREVVEGTSGWGTRGAADAR